MISVRKQEIIVKNYMFYNTAYKSYYREHFIICYLDNNCRYDKLLLITKQTIFKVSAQFAFILQTFENIPYARLFIKIINYP